MSLEKLLADFDLFDDWEDRYKYIIELGNTLEPLSATEHCDDNKVPGCVSQVWLVTEKQSDNLRFRGDSDAHIVRGLVAILLDLYSDRPPADILAFDARAASFWCTPEHLPMQDSVALRAVGGGPGAWLVEHERPSNHRCRDCDCALHAASDKAGHARA